jgi:hypothetical protein
VDSSRRLILKPRRRLRKRSKRRGTVMVVVVVGGVVVVLGDLVVWAVLVVGAGAGVGRRKEVVVGRSDGLMGDEVGRV